MDQVESFLKDKNGPRAHLLLIQPKAPAPISTDLPQLASPAGVGLSPISSQESVGSSDAQSDSPSSRKSSCSSATSTAPSDVTMATAEWVSGHILPCIFSKEANCPVLFHRENVQDWYSHSLTHYTYRGAGPPNHALCIFCDTVFDSADPLVCWQNRMQHIANHLLDDADPRKKRPDFRVAKDMLEKGCITEEGYNECLKDNERPKIRGLRPHNYMPAEIKAKDDAVEREQNCVVVRDSRREKDQGLLATSQRRSTKGRNKPTEIKPMASKKHSNCVGG